MADEPSPVASRRTVLATGAVSIASVAGCSTLTSSPPMLDLAVFNQTEHPYTVALRLLRVGSDHARNEARAYASTIDIAPQGETRQTDVAEARQYLVEYDLFRNDSERTEADHVHFYPTEGTENDTLTFDIRSPGVMTER